MSNDRNMNRVTGNALVTSIGQAASVMATAISEYVSRTMQAAGHRGIENFAQEADRAENRDPAVNAIEATFNQYRDALGDLAMALPQIAQRASMEWQAEPGMRLLYRAGPAGHAKDLHEALLKISRSVAVRPIASRGSIASAGDATAWTTEATRRAVNGELDPFLARGLSDEAVFEHVESQYLDERRRDLPRFLEEVRDAIRRDREDGLRIARERLQWLATAEADAAHEFLDRLDHWLGTSCLREILHGSANFWAFANAIKAPDDPSVPWDGLRDTFGLIGIVLGDRLTLTRVGRVRTVQCEFVLLDHESDRVFRLRPGALVQTGAQGAPATTSEIEVYGLEEGRHYVVNATPKPAPRPPPPRCSQIAQPLSLPLRVREASQGMAVWAVDRRDVQEYLDARFPADLRMRAWDMGAARTPLALFAVDYRDTDVGDYLELGLGCFVAPRRDPLAVGMVVLGDLYVSTEVSACAGSSIWNYPKTSECKLTVRYWPDKVDWTLRTRDAKGVRPDLCLDLTLPRRGHRTSRSVPLISYTHKFDQWHRARLTRSGSGESLRLGGNGVRLSVNSPAGGAWFAQPGSSHGLFGLLHRFGLCGADGNSQGSRPAYSLWTESMQAELGPPCLVPVPAEPEDR